jgi:membrane peptidoglycan carboxypeptidase
VFDSTVTYEAVKILEKNIKEGTGRKAAIGCPAGGKTGTTDKNTDAWFVGFTPRLATATWVGFPKDRTSMNGLYFGSNIDGGTFPAEIWGDYMKVAKGSFCGGFKSPGRPFQAKPFFGKYSRTGAQGGEGVDGAVQRPTGVSGGGGGGGTFDPRFYDAAPQSAPSSPSPRRTRRATRPPRTADRAAVAAAVAAVAAAVAPMTTRRTRPRTTAGPEQSRRSNPAARSGCYTSPGTNRLKGGMSMREGSARQHHLAHSSRNEEVLYGNRCRQVVQ